MFKWIRRNPWYWVKSKVVYRYHIIDISNMDGYKYGWIDRDHAMFLACFKLLIDFVEKENPTVGLGGIKAYCKSPKTLAKKDPDQYAAIMAQVVREKELRTLYDWFTKERAKGSYFDIKQDDSDQAMLLRLIAVRGSMWT